MTTSPKTTSQPPTGFTVGTRGSALALWQTEHVSTSLATARAARGESPVEVAVRIITTQGDTSLAERLVGQIEKGFFTAELEGALRAGEIDWAVHSLKDLPTRLPADLTVAAVLPRAAPGDVLLVRPEAFLDRGPGRLPVIDDARVGTSSLRRDALIKSFAPTVQSLPLRGNVPTRLEKLRAGSYEAIVLAAAGVERLGLSTADLRVIPLEPRRWQPAPGQGAVAVEARASDPRVSAALAAIDDAATRRAVDLERAFLRVLEGGCSTPFGCFVEGNTAWLGTASPEGWRALKSPLPDALLAGTPGTATADQAIHDVLDRLAAQDAQTIHPQESPDDDVLPLWRLAAASL